jgi:FkbM family methyltransferase
MFWASFKSDYEANRNKYDWIEKLLSDEESHRIYKNIVDFRLSANLAHMNGYTDQQPVQYWEDFLGLKQEGEVFVDVGGFDGFTSEEFIKRCPDFGAVYIFEPEQKNMRACKERLDKFSNVHFMLMGLSNQKGTVKFLPGGSSSVISEDGTYEILVDTLDDCVDDAVSYIKMDIEGAESIAIEGAEKTILNHHPRLAICVYHKPDCLWKIPEQILAIRDDYNIFLRHYTESVTETVMFFIPRNQAD